MNDMLIGLCIGFLVDVCLGWPAWLYKTIGHPVGWLARPVGWLEKHLNHGSPRRRFVFGSAVSLLAIVTATAVWGALAQIAAELPFTAIWLGLLFWPLIAARSMHEHVAAIYRPLAQGDLRGARQAVSMIVGRDPTTLDQAAVARASLESLAENTSDGIVAPIFWGAIFGPAGMAGYKAINTLDSMIAHRNDRYEWFGKVAARLDDLANLIPARLTGLLYVLVSGRAASTALRVMLRDAGLHRSPNAGWPEAAMAGALGVRLSGPRKYGDRVSDEPWLNGDARDPDAGSIALGLRFYYRLLGVLGASLAFLALFT